ncbi:hypothetical protein LCGC14_1848430 [marine sediment metagenome]|uniref:PD-(D/E)XK endonuclease-like domain-containing protein n=1 Tax=marine sediment metagenome TaxID=412755 RepID=A0A0F9JAB2_9ZZZZ
MKITSFITLKDVKEEFKRRIPMPVFDDLNKQIVAEHLGKNAGRVGMAFDYLLRFYLKYLYPHAIDYPWVAEHGFKLLKTEYSQDKKWISKIGKRLLYAKVDYMEFLETGKVKKDLVKSIIFLTKLETYYRSRHVSSNFFKVDREDIKDLDHLISIVPLELFKVKKICVLNPTFANATKLIGMRGDGDLVIDDVLIDIKTVKKIQNLRDYYNQLVGYYSLYKIGGITNMPPSNKIKRLGIYFSRHAYLRIYDVEDFDNKDNDFASFIEWFKERALQEI